MSCSGTFLSFAEVIAWNVGLANGIFCLSVREVITHSFRVKPILLFLLCLSIQSRSGEWMPLALTNSSQIILTQFVSAPFPHPSRAEGLKYKGEFFPADKHYSDSTVAMFIPKGFDDGGQVDFAIHFHGWRNTVAGALEQFKLTDQFIASRRNAILIVPQGPRNAPDSAGGKLEDAEGFKQFMDEAVVLLKKRDVLKKDSCIGQIILSGHSGGYKVMASAIERGGLTDQIREVWLFDGLYAQGEKFLAWSEKSGGRLVNIYTDAGGTKTRTEEMLSQLKQRGTNVLATTDMAVTPMELTTNKFVFLHTDMGHNDVMEKRKAFQKFLETSCLKKMPGN